MERQEQQNVDLKHDWGYKEHNGPAKWCQAYDVANGDRQSPIDIETSKAVYDKQLSTKLLTTLYKTEENLTVVNNGHSIQATINQSSELEGGPLDSKYKLLQFHLHWGAENGRGSEHTIDGKAYEAELHLVHYNCGKYDSSARAVENSDGLTVIGVMLKEGKECAALKPLTDSVRSIEKPGKEPFTCCKSFNPKTLLPDNINAYWTYKGSLTTPPLLECVTWIVLHDPVEISRKQLDELRSLKDGHQDALQDNFRPPCPIKGREVRKSFKSLDTWSGFGYKGYCSLL